LAPRLAHVVGGDLTVRARILKGTDRASEQVRALSRICLAQSGIGQRPGFLMEGFAYKVGAIIVGRVTTRVISTIVKASRTAVEKSPRCNAPTRLLRSRDAAPSEKIAARGCDQSRPAP
jgi:hypothetical protein